MATDLATRQQAGLAHQDIAEVMERVIAAGDLEKLSPPERNALYLRTCESLGLNPLTRPFEYIRLNNKLVLYARKDATDQLRKIHRVGVEIVSRERLDGLYVVTAKATTPDGRQDEEIGAVTIGNLSGDALANALMKATTKAKRRVTLSICGLGFLDETELETIPGAVPGEHAAPAAHQRGEWPKPAPPQAAEREVAALPDLTPLDHYRAIARQAVECGYPEGDVVTFAEDALPEHIRPEFKKLQAFVRQAQQAAGGAR